MKGTSAWVENILDECGGRPEWLLPLVDRLPDDVRSGVVQALLTDRRPSSREDRPFRAAWSLRADRGWIAVAELLSPEARLRCRQLVRMLLEQAVELRRTDFEMTTGGQAQRDRDVEEGRKLIAQIGDDESREMAGAA